MYLRSICTTSKALAEYQSTNGRALPLPLRCFFFFGLFLLSILRMVWGDNTIPSKSSSSSLILSGPYPVRPRTSITLLSSSALVLLWTLFGALDWSSRLPSAFFLIALYTVARVMFRILAVLLTFPLCAFRIWSIACLAAAGLLCLSSW